MSCGMRGEHPIYRHFHSLIGQRQRLLRNEEKLSAHLCNASTDKAHSVHTSAARMKLVEDQDGSLEECLTASELVHRPSTISPALTTGASGKCISAYLVGSCSGPWHSQGNSLTFSDPPCPFCDEPSRRPPTALSFWHHLSRRCTCRE